MQKGQTMNNPEVTKATVEEFTKIQALVERLIPNWNTEEHMELQMRMDAFGDELKIKRDIRADIAKKQYKQRTKAVAE